MLLAQPCLPCHAIPLIIRYELGAEEDDQEAPRRKESSLETRFHVMLVGAAAVPAAVGVLHLGCGEMGYW
jgi:hypothetical protein